MIEYPGSVTHFSEYPGSVTHSSEYPGSVTHSSEYPGSVTHSSEYPGSVTHSSHASSWLVLLVPKGMLIDCICHWVGQKGRVAKATS